MAEPSSTLQAIPAIVLGGTTVATAFPGVDPVAVIGAGGGAGLLVMMAVWVPSFWVRIGYFICAWIFGVLYALEGWFPDWWPKGLGVRAFVAGFMVVLVCTSVVEFFRTGKLPGWIDELRKLRISKGGTPDA